MTVLSGMSNMEQMRDNVATMKGFVSFNESQRAVMEEARQALLNVPSIPCTGCSYCTEGCPQQIPIPRIFRTRNNQILYDLPLEKAKGEYAFATGGRGKASDCVECRQCEDACPQHLEITRLLKECAAALE